MYILIVQRLFIEIFLDFFYFPVWWYSKGSVHAVTWCVDVFKNGNASLAPALWLKNIFIPMYGQSDFQGRVISFFMRLTQVIIRTIGLLIWLFFCCLLFFVWLAVPVFVVWGIIFSLSNK